MRPAAVLLTPGAGSDRDHHTLLALEASLAPLPCVRLDFPYRLAGRPFPDRAPVLIAHIVKAVHQLGQDHAVCPAEVLLIGRSMGGRMCSMAVAEGLDAAGLVLLSYPLHPPGKPDKLRIAHLPRVAVPCLFISGSKDNFATPEELSAATALVAGSVTQQFIPGAGHPLDRQDAELCGRVAEWLDSTSFG